MISDENSRLNAGDSHGTLRLPATTARLKRSYSCLIHETASSDRGRERLFIERWQDDAGVRTAPRTTRLGSNQANSRSLSIVWPRPGGLLRKRSAPRRGGGSFRPRGQLRSWQRYWPVLGFGRVERA